MAQITPFKGFASSDLLKLRFEFVPRAMSFPFETQDQDGKKNNIMLGELACIPPKAWNAKKGLERLGG